MRQTAAQFIQILFLLGLPVVELGFPSAIAGPQTVGLLRPCRRQISGAAEHDLQPIEGGLGWQVGNLTADRKGG